MMMIGWTKLIKRSQKTKFRRKLTLIMVGIGVMSPEARNTLVAKISQPRKMTRTRTLVS